MITSLLYNDSSIAVRKLLWCQCKKKGFCWLIILIENISSKHNPVKENKCPFLQNFLWMGIREKNCLSPLRMKTGVTEKEVWKYYKTGSLAIGNTSFEKSRYSHRRFSLVYDFGQQQSFAYALFWNIIYNAKLFSQDAYSYMYIHTPLYASINAHAHGGLLHSPKEGIYIDSGSTTEAAPSSITSKTFHKNSPD